MNNVMKNVGSALHLPSSKDNQHPSPAGEGGQKSNRISIDVDNSYKVFTEFQVNLRHLATLYKTEHELMKSLNENGLYTAKCYQKMLASSPLQHAVSSTIEVDEKEPEKEKKQSDPEEGEDINAKSKEPDQAESAAVGVTKAESDEDVGYVSFPKMEPEEVLEEQDYNFGKKDSQSSYVATHRKNAVLEQGAKKVHGQDPPSKDSLLKKKEEDAVEEDRTESKSSPTKEKKEAAEEKTSSDHSSDSEFPNDEQPCDENPNNTTFDSEGVNVMVGVIDDDEDSFTHDVIDDDDDSFANDDSPNTDEAKSGSVKVDKETESVKDDDDAETKSIKDDEEAKDSSESTGPVDPDGDVVEARDEESSDVELNQDKGNEPELNKAIVVEEKGKDEVEVVSDEEEKLGDEHVKKVEPSAPELDDTEMLTSFDNLHEATYFDVHKQIYKETNSYLNKHTKLVEYAEDWEKTVTKRVQSMHVEYQKLRKGLNHYIGKVNALENEKRKTEDKNREMAPKRIEKLARNHTKLLGTRRSHDVAGIDLILFIDEIVNRSFKDAFPLLQKSIAFEKDFSSMQAKMYSDLSATAAMLEQASRKESLSSSHRLLQLKNSSPEEINLYKFKGDWD